MKKYRCEAWAIIFAWNGNAKKYPAICILNDLARGKQQAQ